MRVWLFVLALAATFAFGASEASAANCPDARQAGQQTWPRGTIKGVRTLTAQHACGRTLSCTGGRGSQRRACRWL
jgi:hypothetical protein